MNITLGHSGVRDQCLSGFEQGDTRFMNRLYRRREEAVAAYFKVDRQREADECLGG